MSRCPSTKFYFTLALSTDYTVNTLLSTPQVEYSKEGNGDNITVGSGNKP